MINKVIIGKIIQKYRREKKLTQDQLAEKVDLSTNYLSKVERGLNSINVETFLKMAGVLDFSLEDFGINSKIKINQDRQDLIQQISCMSEKEYNVYKEIITLTNKINEIYK